MLSSASIHGGLRKSGLFLHIVSWEELHLKMKGAAPKKGHWDSLHEPCTHKRSISFSHIARRLLLFVSI